MIGNDCTGSCKSNCHTITITMTPGGRLLVYIYLSSYEIRHAYITTCIVFVFQQGAATAAEKMVTLEEFKRAGTVKINPDKPQENARFLTLEVLYYFRL